jgi:hypothetical protein
VEDMKQALVSNKVFVSKKWTKIGHYLCGVCLRCVTCQDKLVTRLDVGAECPQGNGASWCNGACMWYNNQCTNRTNATTTSAAQAVGTPAPAPPPAAPQGTLKKIGSFAQGAKFTECISIADFTSKTLDDQVDTLPRAADGGCPVGFIGGDFPALGIPNTMGGNKFSSQIMCGFTADGKPPTGMSVSTNLNTGKKSYDYGMCFVVKQGLTCSDGSSQLLNGCCKSSDFSSGCSNDRVTHYTQEQERAQVAYEVCGTFATGSTSATFGTSSMSDDIAGGSFQVDKYNTLTPCTGNLVFKGSPAAVTSASASNKALGARMIILVSLAVTSLTGHF